MKHREAIHACEANWYKDVEIRFEKINQQEWSWILETTWREPTETAGSDQSEGGPLNIHTILVSYCPFCGSDLEAKNG